MTMGNTSLATLHPSPCQASWDLVPDHVDQWMYIVRLLISSISTRLAINTSLKMAVSIDTFLYFKKGWDNGLIFQIAWTMLVQTKWDFQKTQQRHHRTLESPWINFQVWTNLPKQLEIMRSLMGLAQITFGVQGL